MVTSIFYVLLPVSYLMGHPSNEVRKCQTGVWTLKCELIISILYNMETIFLSVKVWKYWREKYGDHIAEDPSMNYVILQADLTPSNLSPLIFFKFQKNLLVASLLIGSSDFPKFPCFTVCCICIPLMFLEFFLNRSGWLLGSLYYMNRLKSGLCQLMNCLMLMKSFVLEMPFVCCLLAA